MNPYAKIAWAEDAHLEGVRAVAEGRMSGLDLLDLDAHLARITAKAQGALGARAGAAAATRQAATVTAKARPAFADYLASKVAPAKVGRRDF